MSANDPTVRVTVTAAHVETALRGWLAHFEYDLHKATECGEETGEDTYPEEAADLFAGLVAAAGDEPTPDRAALRDRIAEVLADSDGWEPWVDDADRAASPTWHRYLRKADAVLAVLPAAADRAAVLRDAADRLDADMERFFAEWPDEPRNSPYALGRRDAAVELRRLADDPAADLAAVVAARADGIMPGPRRDAAGEAP